MAIADYDKHDYDYQTYWKGRQYEDMAERLALTKLMRDMSGEYFIDIGGSFGRLLPLYKDKYKHPIIIDYSLKTLQKNNSQIHDTAPNAHVIAANLYHMPFRENSFDGGLMMRVMHHIDDPQKYFEQLNTIMTSESMFLQEFANKIHLKARVQGLLGKRNGVFNLQPYAQPHTDQASGIDSQQSDSTEASSEGVFLNYHPKHLEEIAQKYGFRIVAKRNVSMLRSVTLKKLLPLKVLLILERVAQNLLRFTNLAPSIIWKLTIDEKTDSTKTANPNLSHTSNIAETPEKDKSLSPSDEEGFLKQILVCPKCKGDLDFNDHKATCTQCNAVFEKKLNVWDFRV